MSETGRGPRTSEVAPSVEVNDPGARSHDAVTMLADPSLSAPVPADTSRDAHLQKGERIGDGERFEIVERLGAGGMGLVYRALDLELHRDAAIKFVLPAQRR